jgi:RNA polymerase sigma-70 factor (ECF subfamily)
MPAGNDTHIFEEASPRLLGLAYRILGSRADAEDAVQDTFIKWRDADRDGIDNPVAWLTTACTRRCIDLLRSAHRTRVDYVGAWLPEPIHMPVDDNAENTLALTSSLSTAFLLMLERLTPKERAAYLLHDIFEMPYGDVASMLDMEEAACRKLLSRARSNIDQAKVRHVTPIERQKELLAAFEAAAFGGGTERLSALLSDDIRMTGDGGGKASVIGRVLHGKADILKFVGMAQKWWATFRWVETDLNGGRGVVLFDEGVPAVAMSFGYDEAGQVTDIYVMRNPDKLARLTEAAVS